MRLINTKTRKLEEFSYGKIPSCVLLSHRWEDDEISFQDMQLGREKERKGYAKLIGCCERARERGFAYVWMDTCCIDRTSSAELSEAINSMYNWYREGEECYAFLNDVSSEWVEDLPHYFSSEHMDHFPPHLSISARLLGAEVEQLEFAESMWFTRGWTLQELVAPREVLFFNQNWQSINRKSNLTSLISAITYIEILVLKGKKAPQECSIAQRMSWAAWRETTRPEDQAYSLLGIFNVSMALLYGERDAAFRRLQEEIMKDDDDHSILAWSSREPVESFLAPSPSCFRGRHRVVRLENEQSDKGHSVKNVGLKISLKLLPWTTDTFLAWLNCGPSNSSNHQQLCIYVRKWKHRYYRISYTDFDGEGNVADVYDVEWYPAVENRIYPLIELRRITIGKRTPRELIEMPRIAYGFEVFGNIRSHPPESVLCLGSWPSTRNTLLLEDESASMAGIFRLRDGARIVFLYIAFDLELEPICLLTEDAPPGLQSQNLSRLEDSRKKELLRLDWLLYKFQQPFYESRDVFRLGCKLDTPPNKPYYSYDIEKPACTVFIGRRHSRYEDTRWTLQVEFRNSPDQLKPEGGVNSDWTARRAPTSTSQSLPWAYPSQY